MTRLLNLESYVECCRYSYLFGETPQALIPSPNSLPIAYKEFLEKRGDRPFISTPALVATCPTQLNLHPQFPQPEFLGRQLPDNSRISCLLVRDSRPIDLRDLRQSYLYTSPYHYWNYISQIAPLLTSKPVIFLDLDSFPCNQYFPVTFYSHHNVSTQIPILDFKKGIELDFNPRKLYNRICNDIARSICADERRILDIVAYLQHLPLFEYLKKYLLINPHAQDVELILELPNGEEKYYQKIRLNINKIEEIVAQAIQSQNLDAIAQNHPQYQFILVGQYTILPNLRQRFSQAFIVPNYQQAEFEQIWQQKQHQSFPLYGQYLDRISFQVLQEGSEIWINVPSSTEADQICYEGEQQIRNFVGKYHKIPGEIKESFNMTQLVIDLPIRVNDQNYMKNDREQIYRITNPYFEDTPKIEVRIVFSIGLGTPPLLEVIEVGDRPRKLNAELIDKPEPELISYLSIEDIIANRQKKLQSQLNLLPKRLNQEQFVANLRESVNIIQDAINANSIKLQIKIINSLIETLYDPLKNDIFKFVIVDISNQHIATFLPDIKNFFSLLPRILEILINDYNDLRKIPQIRRTSRTREQIDLLSKIYNKFILFTGKLYGLSKNLRAEFLFNDSYPTFNFSLHRREYIKVLARLAVTVERQKFYIALFNQKYQQGKNQEFYEIPDYIWGYARLFLWYIDDYNSAGDWLDYRHHFKTIANHLLMIKLEQSWKQDALISLIYLLAFRELDSEFCAISSEEYVLAKAVSRRLETSPVFSNHVSKNLSLNKLLDQLLDGTATSEQTRGMLEID
ncbi:hypothetical protein Cri9333_1602 [Crinalium epipsammum PCC 9333]|uniref:Uncharacterized protein n=1 Tax=Crinalium epipsammum PCC 9333 TaxID=1173022 RepID=K9VYA0_9CYAN|nr:hypothetical protein [Crinalium epipsammum]AFZ12492.1 hypothetical protein Cri9333_1602 [Crinalium epipsammum PCC 9333]